MRIKNIDIHLVDFFTAMCKHRPGRRGYTLVEMLLSVVLTLMLMYGVAEIFSMVGNSVNDSRALLGIGDRLRATQARLQLDLDGVTSHMTPPAKPENNEGYFELIEGPVGPTLPLISTATITSRVRNTDEATAVDDTTAIDYDDILMFTTRTTTNEPFIGRAGPNATVESRFAEVAWFVRGRTLYRRVKIVKPDYTGNLTCTSLYGASFDPNPSNFASSVSGGSLAGLATDKLAFENQFDLSARFEGDPANLSDQTAWKWVPNSLSDLTKRENRMYHAPILPITVTSYLRDRFPFSPHDTAQWQVLGLPTVGETSNLNWMLYQWGRFAVNGGFELPVLIDWNPQATLGTRTLSGNVTDLNPANQELDFWNEPHPYDELDPVNGNITEEALQSALKNIYGTGTTVELRSHQRLGEDVIMNNVIGFDVKVWDPDAPVLSYNGHILKPGDPGYPNNSAAPLDLTTLPTGVWSLVSYGAFVDLGYGNGLTGIPTSQVFAFAPNPKSGLSGSYVYDTWSTHYEFDGIDQDATTTFFDAGYDGIDNDPDGTGSLLPNGLVDDSAELDTMPPYPVPLQAIQIKIRVFEPESQQVREVTIVHKF